MIYNMQEGFKDLFEKRFIPENENDYLNYLNSILNTALDAYKKIIKNRLGNTGNTVKFPASRFISQRSGSKAIAHIAYINNALTKGNNGFELVFKTNLNHIISDISAYNIKNNIEYMHVYVEHGQNQNTHVVAIGVLYRDIKELVDGDNSVSESSIFESAEFI